MVRLNGQRLGAVRHSGAPDALLRAIVGVQAQEPSAAALAIRVRSVDLTAADLERAQYEERRILRTWVMRGTLHLIAAQDAGWLTALLGPSALAGYRRRRAQLGLDDATFDAAQRALLHQLAHGPQTRAELRAALGAQGLPVDGQAIVHLIMAVAMRGLICEGPQQNGEPAYVRISDWIAHEQLGDAEAAAAELLRRYLAAYGPAAAEDFAAWSGLGGGAARTAWRSVATEMIELQYAGEILYLPRSRAAELAAAPDAAPAARLLPAYDTLLLGYRTRDLFVDPAYARAIHPGGGVLRATLLVNGRAAGLWSLQRRIATVRVRVEPFAPLTGEEEAAVADEVAALGRFSGLPATLSIV